MKDKSGKIFFWKLVALFLTPIVAVIVLTLWPIGEKLYLKIRIAFSSGAEQLLRVADYEIRYKEDPRYSETQMRCQRMRARLELGYPTGVVLGDYAELKRINPKFYSWNTHLPEIALLISRAGDDQKCIEILEELLATTALQTDAGEYAEFQKNLAPIERMSCTPAIFRNIGIIASSNIKETYANFRTSTKNRIIRRDPRTIELAQKLKEETPDPEHMRILASALACKGEFQEALKTLSAAEQLHNNKYKDHSSRQPDGFLERISLERTAFSKGQLILSPLY